MTPPPRDEDFRLPRNVRPSRYSLLLCPFIEDGTFEGRASIELEVLEPSTTITLNALDLQIDSATICSGWSSAGELGEDEQAVTVSYAPELERATFHFARQIDEGHQRLSFVFSGRLSDKLSGFYRSTFEDESGATRYIATTQFEETDARRAFPCFDEPDRKAVFDITLDVPLEATAISNGPELSSTNLENGLRRVRFGATIPMSTYLVAFIVGPLVASEAVNVDGVPIRVYTVPGKQHLVASALEAAQHALRFFRGYFDIDYPAQKLDLVALPDFAAGAMENLACVTFRETILLVDPQNASRSELERLTEVVEHEIAHMWFGDLVTMEWWNGIWLNEAFATFMALTAQHDFRPEWESFVSFSRAKASALQVDALHSTRAIEFPVRHPDEAAAMFDILTYEKGAGVLWMIEQFLGGDRFRAGVRRYLKDHLYGNTATGDLWDAIEAEAGDVPIRAIMDTWIYQGGFPLLSVENDDDTTLIRQEPFTYLPAADGAESFVGDRWVIPVHIASLRQIERSHRMIIEDQSMAVVAVQRPLLVNKGGAGFFRVHYDDDNYARLLEALTCLSGVERFNLASDTWALILAGRSELSRLTELADALGEEQDPFIWSIVIGAFGLFDLLAQEPQRPEIARIMRGHLSAKLESVGWEPRSTDNEQTPLLRSSLIGALGTFAEDPEVIARCRALFRKDLEEKFPLDANIAGAVLSTVASHCSREEFAAIVDRSRHASTPNEQLRHLNCLAQLTQRDFAAEVRSMCLEEIRSQDAPYLLGSMLRNRPIGRDTWSFIAEHFDELCQRFPDNSIHRMLDGISALAQVDEDGGPLVELEVRKFCDDKVTGARRRLIDQSLERLSVNVRLAQRLRQYSFEQ